MANQLARDLAARTLESTTDNFLGSHSTPVYEAFLRRDYSDGTWRHLAALRCVYSDDSSFGLVSDSR